MNIAPWIPCTQCNAPIIVEEVYTDNFFKGIHVSCESCRSDLNWWDAVHRAIRENFMFNQAFSVLGANTNIIKVILRPNSRSCIKLSDHGIPFDARVLYVNYTPQGGGLFPLEIHGNVPRRKIIGDEIWLYPAILSNEQEASETEVAAMVTWVNHTTDEIDLVNITDAFEAYSNNQFLDSIVPANVAVESSLSKLLTNLINKYIPKKTTEEFLTNAATYSSQLNVVLPLIVSLLKLPELPENIRGSLNRLRKYRNQLAHNGTTKKPFAKEDASETLCAALFGLRYISLIETIVNENA
jgi:hypothetical protein